MNSLHIFMQTFVIFQRSLMLYAKNISMPVLVSCAFAWSPGINKEIDHYIDGL